MDIQLYVLFLIAAVALGASLVQSITGFGFGIVAMIFLPRLLQFTEANVLSTMLSMLTSIVVVIPLLKIVSYKNLIFPLIGSVCASYVAVNFAKSAQNSFLTLLLGLALFFLSIYFFFFSGKIKIRPTFYAGLIAGVLSGILGGLFSIGGPPVVIYYMQSEKDTQKYLATLSAYFVISDIISIFIKAASGFVTLNVLYCFVVGIVGMLLGSLAGVKVRSYANPTVIKKAVYGFMALSGIVNVITYFI